ncbi:MAG: type II toxin-antitoxin system RelE/ParE family toxin [Actinobacteria bacterium]|nr:type II toxin-antitoxin system RelE/ParE family toxin [Actinomycetota bacterium]MBM3712936.1 type II toxin-antitoxin system RelE/ParE family toxin [Actinomycetota bacterium]
MWNVILYTTDKGGNPVGDFIKSLSKKEEAKVLREVDLLQQKGIYLNFPHSSDIDGYKGLRELRIRFSSSNIRIFYFLHIKNTFILLHGFRKKTKRILKKELEIAIARMNDYLKRMGDLK